MDLFLSTDQFCDATSSEDLVPKRSEASQNTLATNANLPRVYQPFIVNVDPIERSQDVGADPSEEAADESLEDFQLAVTSHILTDSFAFLRRIRYAAPLDDDAR